MTNPYAPPASAPARAELPVDAGFGLIARHVFLAWEKLRPAFVALLGIVALPLVVLADAPWPAAVKILLEGAVAANLLYFAGPLLETSICWLGLRVAWVRWGLFIGGTLLSLILTVVVITSTLPGTF